MSGTESTLADMTWTAGIERSYFEYRVALCSNTPRGFT